MRILYLITSMHNSAGMERVVANKANYLINMGYNVTVATTDQNGRPDFYNLEKGIKRIDLEINFWEYNKAFFLIRPFIFLKKNKRFQHKLHALFLEEKYDVVNTLTLKSISFLYKIKDGSQKNVEHHFSKEYVGQFSDSFKRNLFERFLYYLRGKQEAYYLKKYDNFIVLTHDDAEMWGSSYKNLKVIPNNISFVPKHLSTCKNRIAVAVGRLDYQKGFDDLLKIWKEANLTKWELKIYGEGQDKEKLLNYIKLNNLEKQITILPVTRNIQSALQEGSIYLMTSRFEGFPMVLIEAMACGLPAIAFACKCGPSEIIKHENDGYLIPQDNHTLFIEKLLSLTNNESIRIEMGKQATKNIQRFSKKNVMDQWEKLFRTNKHYR